VSDIVDPKTSFRFRRFKIQHFKDMDGVISKVDGLKDKTVRSAKVDAFSDTEMQMTLRVLRPSTFTSLDRALYI